MTDKNLRDLLGNPFLLSLIRLIAYENSPSRGLCACDTASHVFDGGDNL